MPTYNPFFEPTSFGAATGGVGSFLSGIAPERNQGAGFLPGLGQGAGGFVMPKKADGTGQPAAPGVPGVPGTPPASPTGQPDMLTHLLGLLTGGGSGGSSDALKQILSSVYRNPHDVRSSADADRDSLGFTNQATWDAHSPRKPSLGGYLAAPATMGMSNMVPSY